MSKGIGIVNITIGVVAVGLALVGLAAMSKCKVCGFGQTDDSQPRVREKQKRRKKKKAGLGMTSWETDEDYGELGAGEAEPDDYVEPAASIFDSGAWSKMRSTEETEVSSFKSSIPGLVSGEA